MPVTRFKIKSGKVTVDAEGFQGDACQKANKPYLDALNSRPGEQQEELKPEFYVDQAQQAEAGG